MKRGNKLSLLLILLFCKILSFGQIEISLHDSPFIFEAYYTIAQKKIKERRFDSAIIYLKKSLTSCPYNNNQVIRGHCLLSLAHSFAANGIPDSAENYLHKIKLQNLDSANWSIRFQKEYHYLKGHIFYTKNKADSAEQFLKYALQLQVTPPKDSLNTLILKDLGNVSYTRFNYDKAEGFYNQAMNYESQRTLPDELLISSLYQNLSIVYAKKFRVKKANEYFRKALKTKEKLLKDDDISLIKVYLNYGVFLNDNKYYDSALLMIEKAEELALNKLNSKNQLLAHIYANKASILLNLSRNENSLAYSDKAIINFQENKINENALDYCYFNRALYFYNNEDYKNVIKNLSYIVNKVNIEPYLHVIATLIYANTYEVLKLYNQADSMYCRSINLANSFGLRNSPIMSRIKSSYGRFLTRQNNLKKAEFFLKQSFNDVANYNKLTKIDKIIIIQNLASFYQKINKHDSAIFYYDQIIDCFGNDCSRRINNSSIREDICKNSECINLMRGKAISIFAKLKKFERDQSKDSLYLAEISDLLEIATHLITNKIIKLQKPNKIYNIDKNYRSLFELAVYVQYLLFTKTNNRYNLNNTFKKIEESKSTNLRIGINILNALKFSNIPENLVDLEIKLKALLKYYNQIISTFEIQSRTPDNEQLLVYKNLRFKSLYQYDTLINYFENNFPNYFALKHNPKIASLSYINSKLDYNQALINYYLSDSILFTGLISKDRFDIIKTIVDTNLHDIAKGLFHAIKNGGDKKEIIGYSHRLYNILIKPTLPYITDKKKLIIIPDGPLYYVPFEFLIKNKPNLENFVDFTDLEYLIQDFSISYHYSATLWARSKTKDSIKNTLRKPKFLGVAPTFNTKNPNPQMVRNNSFQKGAVSFRSIINDGNYSDLTYAKKEVENIAKLFKKNGYETILLLDSLATEKNLKLQVKGVDYIHIATHGFSNDSKPELSGLAMYPSNNQDTTHIKHSAILPHSNLNALLEESNDNILYAGEMFNLDLTADLVVLSACESGVGKVIKGEGMIALTRGLIYSGAKNILYTLWKISDKHTEKFMFNLYTHILDGKSYPEALRQAKLYMLQNQSTAFPKLWVGYMLLGN